MSRADEIHVEIFIRGSMDELWRRTQTPELHERWDLRFSSIEYLPREPGGEVQRFLYTTRIGFGLAISGTGETVGSRADAAGRRTSALRFASADPKSLILEGAGYWQYVPEPGGVRFLTRYDYRTRFGAAGRWLDRLAFRPLIGWATAWSFDRLRLWIEEDRPPEATLRLAAVRALTRAAAVGAGLAALAPRRRAALPLAALALAGWGIGSEGVPSAGRCRRRPGGPG